uniref:Uncharacterized protein n=1 Tax=Arundo donax TaxID=35708 RepID=A0A0A9CCC3_ARUDO
MVQTIMHSELCNNLLTNAGRLCLCRVHVSQFLFCYAFSCFVS